MSISTVERQLVSTMARGITLAGERPRPPCKRIKLPQEYALGASTKSFPRSAPQFRLFSARSSAKKVVFGPEGLTSISVNYVAEARNLVLYLNMGLWLLWYAQQELW